MKYKVKFQQTEAHPIHYYTCVLLENKNGYLYFKREDCILFRLNEQKFQIDLNAGNIIEVPEQ
jgi:hypothetical protein